MRSMQIPQRRNASLIDLRNNSSKLVVAHRSSSPIMNRLSPVRVRNQIPNNVQMIHFNSSSNVNHNALRQLISQPLRQQPSPPRQRQVSYQYMPVVPTNPIHTIIKVIRQPCCHRNMQPERLYKTVPSPVPQDTYVKFEESRDQMKQGKHEEQAVLLKNDSLYTNTYNSPKDSFSMPILEDQSSIQGSNRQKYNKFNVQETPTQANSVDPLQQCITSLEHRVEMLMKLDSKRHRSKFLMQIVHQGTKHSDF